MELDRNLPDFKIEAFGNVEHFDIEGKTIQPQSGKDEVGRLAAVL